MSGEKDSPHVTKSKETEIDPVEYQQRLSYIIDFLPDATFAINAKGDIIAWNRAIEAMTGAPAVQMIGKSNYEYSLPFYGTRRPMLIDLVLKPDKEIEKNYSFISNEMDCLIAEPKPPFSMPGKIRYLWAKASPMRDPSGNLIGAIESIRDITDYKTIEATLKENEETIRILLNANPETQLLVDRNGTILAGNSTFAQRIGRKIEDIIGQSLWELLPREIADSRKLRMSEAASSGRTVHFVDSREGYVYDNYHYPIQDRSGLVRMVAIFAIDITDRVNAEKALRESEERYRIAIEYSNDGVAIVKGGIHMYVNQKFVQMFGYDNVSDIIGQTNSLTVHPDDLALVSDFNRRREAGESVPLRYAFKGIKKNGEIVYIETSVTSIRIKGESASLVYLRDITEQKCAEEELRASEAKYRLLIDTSNEGIMVVQDGNVQFVNRIVLYETGYKQEEMLYKPFQTLVHPDDSQMIFDRYLRRKQGDSPEVYSFRVFRKDGEIRWIELHGTEFTWEGRPAHLFFLNDVTERKFAEEEASLQHSFSLALASASGFDETLDVCVETTLKISGMDSGAVFLVENAHDMAPAHSKGLSSSFIEKIARTYTDSPEWRPAKKGSPGYYGVSAGSPLMAACIDDGLACIGIIPVKHAENVIGSIFVSSHYMREIPDRKRQVLETIAAQMGNFVQRVSSEKKFHSIFENAVEGIFRCTPEGMLLDANPAMARMFGYDSPQEMIQSFSGRERGYYHDTGCLDAFRELIQRDGMVVNFEAEVYRKDGTTIWVSENTTAIKDKSGKTRFFEGTIENITAKKLAADALLDSELRYRTLLDNAGDAIFLIADNIFVDCNQKSLHIFECTKEQIIGKTPFDFSPSTQPDGRDSVKKGTELIQQAQSGNGQFFEWKHCTRTGKLFDTEVSLNSIQLGTRTYTQAIIRDVTDRKKYEQSVKLNLAKLRKATGGIIDVIAMAVETRDPYTAGHQKRVTNLARSIAKEMGLTETIIESLRMAGRIHDVGKISIPAEILTRPRALTEMEYELVKTHAQVGYDILKDIEFPGPVAEIVYQHHERLNGSGYPRGLKQSDILIEARILAVCDVVESMASHRPYRPALGIDASIDEIKNNKGTLYDATVVDACVRLFRQKGFSFG